MLQSFDRRRPLAVLAALVLGGGLLGACGGKSGAAKPSSPDVWAIVNDHEIRRDDVEKAYRGAVQPTPTPPSDDEMLTVKMSILDELINQELFLARAKALNLDVTDAEIETAFGERKRAVPEESFQQQLTQRGLTVDDMKKGLRRELIVQKVMDREIAAKIAVTEQDISDFYGKNRAQFNVPETQYHIAQIVITPVRESQLRNRLNDDAATPADAEKKAQMLMEKLRTGGDFAALAMDYSEDARTAPQGGDLGFVSASALNQVPQPLRDTVLRAEPGNVRAVSAGGAHTLVMLVAREAAGQRELTEPAVRDTIRDTLRQRKEQLFRTAYVTAARNDARITNHLAKLIVDAQGKLPSLVPIGPGK